VSIDSSASQKSDQSNPTQNHWGKGRHSVQKNRVNLETKRVVLETDIHVKKYALGPVSRRVRADLKCCLETEGGSSWVRTAFSGNQVFVSRIWGELACAGKSKGHGITLGEKNRFRPKAGVGHRMMGRPGGGRSKRKREGAVRAAGENGLGSVALLPLVGAFKRREPFVQLF